MTFNGGSGYSRRPRGQSCVVQYVGYDVFVTIEVNDDDMIRP